jgi:hypothetical protein
MERSAWADPEAVGKGWWPIIAKLEEQLLELDTDYEVLQIKEKFGGLRYYFASSGGLPDEKFAAMTALVQQAENESYRTCEECGQPGEAKGPGWIRTLCDQCRG